jgi:hypothetical protein
MVKYPKQIIPIFFTLSIMQLQAQQTCNLHIVTIPNNQMQSFSFQFEVNGTPYKLKARQCLELQLSTDSINIVINDNRWVKKETVELHTKAGHDVYVSIFWGWKLNEKKKLRCIAEQICKSCFDELKPKCKKEFSD